MQDQNQTSLDGGRRTAISQALRLRCEIETFQKAWPAPQSPQRPMPEFTWEQLERQLADLSLSPIKANMARDLVSATRKQASFKPPEMVLREILCLAWALVDEDFQPAPGAGPVAMT